MFSQSYGMHLLELTSFLVEIWFNISIAQSFYGPHSESVISAWLTRYISIYCNVIRLTSGQSIGTSAVLLDDKRSTSTHETCGKSTTVINANCLCAVLEWKMWQAVTKQQWGGTRQGLKVFILLMLTLWFYSSGRPLTAGLLDALFTELLFFSVAL